MRKLLRYPHGLTVFAILGAFAVELFKFFLHINELIIFLLGFSSSLIVIAISVQWEKYRNKIEFYEIIKELIPKIKRVKEQGNIPSDEIQNLMKSLVGALGDKMRVNYLLERDFKRPDDFNEQTNLPCGICSTDHKCDKGGKCRHCKLGPGLWVELINQ